MTSLNATRRVPKLHTFKADQTWLDEMNKLNGRIECRAFELFKARGGEHGHDLDDWLQAESEICGHVPVEIMEGDGEFRIDAELPGFQGDEIEVAMDSHRVNITGKLNREQADMGANAAKRSVFCALFLPMETMADKATAVLRNGHLQICLPKLNTESIADEQTRVLAA